MMIPREIETQELNLNEHFLAKRLRRVTKDVLKVFLLKWNENIKRDISQKDIISEIISQLKLRKANPNFISEFKIFLRDSVLCARESEYLVQISDNNIVISWLNTLIDQKFAGKRYDFIFHSCIDFEERILEESDNEEPGNNCRQVSFPTKLFLLIAISKIPIIVSNGIEPLEYHPTSEFEIIFRNDINLIEVRGEFQIIQDFVNTAMDDKENPLTKAQSIFVGERKEDRANTSLLIPATFINIENLRNAINGTYSSVSSAVAGVKASRVTMEFEGLNDSNEETDHTLRLITEKIIKDPDRSKIKFSYNNKEYTFGITKSGGLTFQQYMPEDVITFMLKRLIDIYRS